MLSLELASGVGGLQVSQKWFGVTRLVIHNAVLMIERVIYC